MMWLISLPVEELLNAWNSFKGKGINFEEKASNNDGLSIAGLNHTCYMPSFEALTNKTIVVQICFVKNVVI